VLVTAVAEFEESSERDIYYTKTMFKSK